MHATANHETDARPAATDPDVPLRCLLADDAAAIRSVVRMSLDVLDWIDVCGEFEDGPAALDAIERLRPDVAILDMRMPEMSGFDVAARVREHDLPVSIIVFSAFSDRGMADRAAALDVRLVDKLDGVPALHEALIRIRGERRELHG